MSALYLTGLGSRIIPSPDLKDSSFISSDVKVMKLTLEGQEKLIRNVPIRELVDGIDLVVLHVETYRATPSEFFYKTR